MEKYPFTVIHPSAKIGENVKIGPFVTISENVEIGDGTIIDSNVQSIPVQELVSIATYIPGR